MHGSQNTSPYIFAWGIDETISTRQKKKKGNTKIVNPTKGPYKKTLKGWASTISQVVSINSETAKTQHRRTFSSILDQSHGGEKKENNPNTA